MLGIQGPGRGEGTGIQKSDGIRISSPRTVLLEGNYNDAQNRSPTPTQPPTPNRSLPTSPSSLGNVGIDLKLWKHSTGKGTRRPGAGQESFLLKGLG